MNGKKNDVRCRVKVFILLVFLFGSLFIRVSADTPKAPEIFSYTELQQLYDSEKNSPSLENKLNLLLNKPLVDNSFQSSAPPLLARSEKIGEFLRVVHWNIERGLEFEAIEAVFKGEKELLALLDNERFPPGSD